MTQILKTPKESKSSLHSITLFLSSSSFYFTFFYLLLHNDKEADMVEQPLTSLSLIRLSKGRVRCPFETLGSKRRASCVSGNRTQLCACSLKESSYGWKFLMATVALIKDSPSAYRGTAFSGLIAFCHIFDANSLGLTGLCLEFGDNLHAVPTDPLSERSSSFLFLSTIKPREVNAVCVLESRLHQLSVNFFSCCEVSSEITSFQGT